MPFLHAAETFGERYEFLPKAEILTFEEIVRVANTFVDLGVSKIRLTGGEPLLRNDLEVLVYQLAKIKGITDLALTTNGFLLSEKAQALKDAGLHRITVSLHSLDDEVFGKMNGQGFTTERVLQGIEMAASVGFSPLKINVVVQKGVNGHAVVDLARFFKRLGHVIRFIEYMDVGTLNGWWMEDVVSADEIIRRIDKELPLEPLERSYPSEVALRYRYMDGKGEIGVIASVTKPFCGDCARIRLSAEGKLYTCLFASQGHDLKNHLRTGVSDESIKELIASIWGNRTDRYSEERAELLEAGAHSTRAEMFQLGG